MARSYRVSRPSTGSGKADVLFAGGGGRRPPRIPTSTPRLRVDMNWEEAQEKTAHQARVRALADAGYDPKILADMSPEVTARLHAQMADDPIEAEQAKAAAEITKKGGDALSNLMMLGLNFDKLDQEAKAPTPSEIQLEAAPPTSDPLGMPPGDIRDQSQTMANFFKDKEDHVAKIPTNIFDKREEDLKKEQAKIASGAYADEDPEMDAILNYSEQGVDYASKERNLANIFSIYDSLPDSLKEKFYPKFKDAFKEATPKKYDEWEAGKTYSAKVTTKEDKNFYVTWDKRTGKEIGKRIPLPDDPIEWMKLSVWTKDGRRGFYLRDKDDHQNYKKSKDGKPEFFSLPDDATDVRPRKVPSMTMRFNAFLESNKKYADIIPDPVKLLDPEELYLSSSKGSIEREAAVKFFEEDDVIIRMLQELSDLKYGKDGNSESAKAKKMLQDRKNKKPTIELPSTE